MQSAKYVVCCQAISFECETPVFALLQTLDMLELAEMCFRYATVVAPSFVPAVDGLHHVLCERKLREALGNKQRYVGGAARSKPCRLDCRHSSGMVSYGNLPFIYRAQLGSVPTTFRSFTEGH